MKKLKKYGLDEEQFADMLDAQRGRCAICEKRIDVRNRPAHVDHDHGTGLVRGLLCAYCNTELGLHHDDARWFCRAGEYLDSSPAVDVIGFHFVPTSPGATRP